MAVEMSTCYVGPRFSEILLAGLSNKYIGSGKQVPQKYTLSTEYSSQLLAGPFPVPSPRGVVQLE